LKVYGRLSASLTTVGEKRFNKFLQLEDKSSLNLGKLKGCASNIDSCKNGFTLAFWLRQKLELQEVVIIGNMEPRRKGNGFRLMSFGPNFSLTIKTKSASRVFTYEADLGKWKHHVIIWDGNKNASVYVDNIAVKTYNLTPEVGNKMKTLEAAPLRLGWPKYPINADFDDISIWDGALAPEEIIDVYTSSLEKVSLNPVCTDVTTSKLCVSWNLIEDYYGIIESEHLSLNPKGGSKQHVQLSKHVAKKCIENLDALQKYRITHVYKVKNGPTKRSNTIVCSTKDGVPSPPRDLKVAANGTTTLLVSWRMPRVPNGKISSFLVKVFLVKQPKVTEFIRNHTVAVSENNLDIYLTALEPFKKYEIHVSSKSNVGQSHPAIATGSTFLPAEFLHRVPRLRLKTKLKNKTAEIHVRWQSVASFSIAPSIFYLLYYNQFRHDPIQIKTKLTSHKLQNLELNTVYYINIMACTKDGCGKRLEYDKFITTPDENECDDIFENRCDSQAECINTLESYLCKCKDGFVGDGFLCRRIPSDTHSGHYCQEELYRGVTWSKTYSGGVAVEKCPEKTKGYAVRGCGKATSSSVALFQEADLSNCISNEFYSVETQLYIQEYSAEVVMEGLDDVLSFTPDNEIYGGDVIRSINIANQVLYRKRPTEQAALELTAVNMAKALNKLLNGTVAAGWYDIPQGKRAKAAKELLNAVDSATMEVAKELKPRKPFIVHQRNLDLQVEGKITTLSDLSYTIYGPNKTILNRIALPAKELAPLIDIGDQDVVFSRIDNIGTYIKDTSEDE
jgi:hypothetical protein